MQPTPTVSPASPIQVPDIDIDEPVAVIPMASVAPLDGPPDGERINTFALAPKETIEDSASRALGGMRERVRNKPFSYLVAAFSFGYVLARMTR